MFLTYLKKKFLSKYSDLVNISCKTKKAHFSQNIHYINIISLKTLLFTFHIFLLCILAFSYISYNSTINT
jgi:hypothetical protein